MAAMGRKGGPPRGRTGGSRAAGGPADDDQGCLGLERRDLEPEELARLMRAMVGLDPDTAADGEQAAWAHRSPPALLREVDVGGWIGWCLVGLVLFAEPCPTMGRFRAETRRFAVTLAMLRSKGTISVSARMLRLSRSVVRKYLREFGLYPWRAATGAAEAEDLQDRI